MRNTTWGLGIRRVYLSRLGLSISTLDYGTGTCPNVQLGQTLLCCSLFNFGLIWAHALSAL